MRKKKKACSATGEAYGESIERMEYVGEAVEVKFIKISGGVSACYPAMDAMPWRLMRAVEATKLAALL